MKKILLACNAGLSTSMLVQKMQESAEERKIEVEILAVSVSSVEDHPNYDILLLGPQVRFLQDNIKGISRESDNFAQMFYYCGIIYGLDRKYNCGDYEFVKVGMEVREYIIKVQNGDMDDELEADLYDKLTKLTADDIQEVVNAIDN